MNNQYRNPYERLVSYWGVFKENTFDIKDNLSNPDMVPFYITISSLAEKFDIDINIVRMDVIDILKCTKEGFFDVLNLFQEEENPSFFAVRDDKTYDHIIKGEYDNAPLNYRNMEDDFLTIFIDAKQIAAIRKIESDLFKVGNEKNPIMIKDMNNSCMKGFEITSKLAAVEKAIKEIRFVSFLYRDGEKLEIKKIIPLKIIYDGKYEILTCVNGIPERFNLGDIMSTISLGDLAKSKPDSVFLSIMPQVWGYDFVSSPYFVQVRFYDDPGVFNRVRKELSSRVMGELIEKDGCLYYEDTVYGLDAFKEWILSFGNSAVVMKPMRLRNDMIKAFSRLTE